LDRAKKRLRDCRAELARFEAYANPAKEPDALCLCRLQRDVRVAESDYVHAMRDIEQAREAAGLNL
jgi:hypothetical protein